MKDSRLYFKDGRRYQNPMLDPRSFSQSFRKGVSFLSRPAVPFYILPALMLVLVAGTVAQRYMGLYDAQKHFFSSFILWAGPLPLPGGMALTAALGLSLLCKFLFLSPWSRARAGINLAHLGVLVLLVGGWLTALQAREGALLIPEGGRSDIVRDYHDRELTVRRSDEIVARARYADLRPGSTIVSGDAGWRIEILSACRNCGIERRTGDDPEADGYRGMARFMSLHDKRPEKNAEDNLTGVTFRLSGVAAEADGIYIAFDPMPQPIEIAAGAGGAPWSVLFGKAERRLPFALALTAFHHENYPGTRTPRHYRSDLVLRDGDVEWPVIVEMNRPLRYRDYTFFQSSFLQMPDGTESTVLSVVENDAWLFPYIGSGLMGAGLLYHLVLLLRRRKTA